MPPVLAWAIAIALVVLAGSLAYILVRGTKEVKSFKVGLDGIHASLNGHPTDESLGRMVYETRDLAREAVWEVRGHKSLSADEAHR